MANVDDRVVEMEFNNRSFETGVATTLGTLQKLKNALDFTNNTKSFDDLDKAASRFSMGNMGTTIEGVSKKFLALGTIGVTAIANISNRAIDAGINIAKSLTIDPIKAGFQSYETQINAVQTILANTQAAGVKLPQVTAALAELNKYANLTVYNFSEMARNIGTFTAAGVDLKTSVSSIKGIANLAALSGSTSEQASGAMYQLSQAIAAGTVKLQDWNSVVNAGIGGKTFQTALINTARTQGVAIDDIIKKQGSFRNSLQKGWLTSDILTKTLSQFTGDLSLAQIKAMGYTDKEAQAIFKMGQTAVGAATKIKTVTQLMQALKEEVATAYGAVFKTIFGNINEATTLFSKVHTAVENALTNPIYDLNKKLEAAVKLGARTNVIKGLTSGIHALSSVIHAVGDAWREIFPASSAKNIADATKTFANFMHRLVPSKVTLIEIKKTFAGLFAILDIGKQIVVGIVGVIARMFGAFSHGSGSVLDVTSTVGDFLVALDQSIKKGGGLIAFFKKLGDILVVPVMWLSNLRDAVASLFVKLDDSGLSNFGSGFDKLGQKISPVGKILSTIHDKIVDFAYSLSRMVSPALQGIVNLFSTLGQSIANSIHTGNFTGIMHVLETGLLGGIFLTIKRFLEKGLPNIPALGLFGKIGESLEHLTGSLKAMQQNIQAKTLRTIAEAIGILTISVVALSLINSDNLAKALKATAVGFGELLGAMKLMVLAGGEAGLVKLPVIAASLDLLAGGILLLTASVLILSTLSWKDLTQGLVGVGSLLAGISAAAFVLSKNEVSLVAAGIGITAMAVGINLLAGAVKLFSLLSWTELGKGLAGVGGALVAIAIGMKLMPKGLIFTGTGLIAVAIALEGIYLAVKQFSQLKWEQIGTGIGAIALSLTAIALAMHIMPKGIVLQATGLVVLAGALLIIQKAVSSFGAMSWESIAKGLAAMAASLGILAAAMYLMTGAIAGAASLVIITAALALFVPVLKGLGEMSWGQILKGLVALAAAFTVLGVAGLLLAPIGPILLAIGAAITLIGAGVFLAGAGISALAAGLGVLGASGAAGIAVLVGAFEQFIAEIPKIAVAFAEGLVGILKVIGENGPGIIKALGQIIEALVKVIIAEAPRIAEAAGVLLKAFLKFLVDNAPNLIAAGFQLLMDLLQGISDNIEQVTSAVAGIIVKFLDALAVHAADIAAAGLGVLVGFLDGIASGLGRIVDAVGGIVTKFISSLSDQLNNVIAAGANMIVSFITGLGQHVEDIITAGTNAMIHFIKGFSDNAVAIANATGAAILAFINGLDAAVNKYESQIIASTIQLGVDIVLGIIKGIGQEAKKLEHKILGLITDPLGTLKDFIESASPSKLFAREIGAPIAQGIAVGIDKNAYHVTTSMTALAKNALSTMTGTLSKIPDMISGVSNFNPVLTPVLDLSHAKRQADELHKLIDVGQPLVSHGGKFSGFNAYQSRRSAGFISADQQRLADIRMRDQVDAAPGNTTIEFKQYNNSPKALSTIDIYRHTRTQLGQAKYKHILSQAP